MKELTDKQIEDLAVTHESFGFGRADGTLDGCGYHGFDFAETFAFARAAIAADRALNAPADRDVMQEIIAADIDALLYQCNRGNVSLQWLITAIEGLKERYLSPTPPAEQQGEQEPAAWAATSEAGVVEALGMNQSRRFDTPLYTRPAPSLAELRAKVEALHNGSNYGPWLRNKVLARIDAAIDKMGGKV